VAAIKACKSKRSYSDNQAAMESSAEVDEGFVNFHGEYFSYS
jgi:hypothetical protein